MKKISCLLLIFSLAYPVQTMAQSEIRNNKMSAKSSVGKPFGLYSGVSLLIGEGEYGYYKFQADYFISPKVNLEANVYAILEGGSGFGLGANYYFVPQQPKKIKPYAGLNLGMLDEYFAVQVPIGLSYMAKKGFQAKLGLSGYGLMTRAYKESGVFGDLGIGWRF